MTKWHKGPPPSIGWWPASRRRNKKLLRWWNGVWWSIGCVSGFPAYAVTSGAAKKAHIQDEIEWTDRPASWPERSKT